MSVWVASSRTAASIAVAAASLAATPAAAERWQQIDQWPYGQSSIDLDSVHWDGRTVRYRLEIRRDTQGGTRRAVSTSLIDCDRKARKWLEIENFAADGSSSKDAIDEEWKAITPSTAIDRTRHYLCDSAP